MKEKKKCNKNEAENYLIGHKEFHGTFSVPIFNSPTIFFFFQYVHKTLQLSNKIWIGKYKLNSWFVSDVFFFGVAFTFEIQHIFFVFNFF